MMKAEEYCSSNVVVVGSETESVNPEDSGNSCGSSVISEDLGGQSSCYDGDGVQVSDLEIDSDESLPIMQVSFDFPQ